jgi:hypothetical protein
MSEVMDFDNGVEVTLRNKKVKWCKVHEPDTKFESAWMTDILFDKVADADEIETMRDQGYNFKEYKDGNDPDVLYIRAKSKTHTKAGKANRPPMVVGRDGTTPFTEEIGNGSECNIKLYVKKFAINKDGTLTTYLNGLQVVSHVAFSGNAGFEAVPDEEVSQNF